MTFDSLVQESVQVIVDKCILHEGNCEACELKGFCSCDKPIEYAEQR